MNVCGIVAEYNPFHNGHLHHLLESRQLTDADYIIVVMSGNFMQRGTPALIDKYERTRSALSCGADLVIELPTYYSTGSAEYFATGAVSLLDKLGVVTHISFGSECGNVNLLKEIADVIASESPHFQHILRSHLKSGETYPSARNAALLEICPGLADSMDVLTTPNNILGIEYLKALKRFNSTICPFTIKRQGSDYHDKRLGLRQSSATALRQALQDGMSLQKLQNQMPPTAYEVLENYSSNNLPIYLNDFSEILYYKLLSEQEKGYEEYIDVSSALSDRIRKHLYEFDGFDHFCDLLKTKEITYSRISRCLLHILLNMKKDQLDFFINDLNITPYARILGFSRSSSDLLSAIHNNSKIPLVTKLADAHKTLSPDAQEMLKQEIRINDIYSLIRASKAKIPMMNEYSTPLVII